ncbi:hypothetical protein ElyMa_002368800 [Elysia marginata]|uniref:Ribosomal RNA-processing protein 14/surfeit locus protein 6 C-terminal domain-containing protein n=1 Tax=Elysia marginata TaxID=1093978 RepID=A0AAV4GAL8_9GAST|nr:hypothetical protein ElyMa_002368800 [Elysia marginata]
MLIPQMILFMGTVSRIRVLSKSIQEKAVKVYKEIFVLLGNIPQAPSKWIEPPLLPCIKDEEDATDLKYDTGKRVKDDEETGHLLKKRKIDNLEEPQEGKSKKMNKKLQRKRLVQEKGLQKAPSLSKKKKMKSVQDTNTKEMAEAISSQVPRLPKYDKLKNKTGKSKSLVPHNNEEQRLILKSKKGKKKRLKAVELGGKGGPNQFPTSIEQPLNPKSKEVSDCNDTQTIKKKKKKKHIKETQEIFRKEKHKKNKLKIKQKPDGLARGKNKLKISR